MLTIGVSGLTGMIGRNLILELRRSPEAKGRIRLVAFVRSASRTAFLRQHEVELRELDYEDPRSMAGKVEDLDAFIHLAGLTKSPKPLEFYTANTRSTETVLRALKRYGRRLRHFLFSSSLSAAGPSRSADHLKNESEPCNPVSEYGRSKLLAEQLIRDSGLPWTVIRFPVVFGPFDRDGLFLMRLARLGWSGCFGAEENCFSYLFAQDASALMLRIVDNHRMFGGVYNLCYDKPCRTSEFLRRVRAELGLPGPIRCFRLPCWFGRLAARFLAGWQGLIGKASITNPEKIGEVMAGNWTASNRKIRDALNLPSIQEQGALAETVRWFRERGLL